MNKIKVSAVSYLNTKPFLHGLEIAGLLDSMELQLNVPSMTGRKIIDNEVDLALVPVAILPQLEEHEIITNYCIGTERQVDSVCLFSHRPLEEIRSILCDYQSLTSVNLCRVLMHDHWKREVNFIDGKKGYINNIKDDVAGIIIGDRALRLKNDFPYVYDLATAWNDYCKLPFVFAVWVANNTVTKEWESELNKAFALGMADIHSIANFYQNRYQDVIDPLHYFTKSISYDLDVNKYKALDLFLSRLKALRTKHLDFS